MALERIGGENDTALLCRTNQTACCRRPFTGENRSPLGNWYFPNGTRVPARGSQWDMHRDRGHSLVRMYRRGGGEDGIYRCEIPDSMNVTQTIYIGVYTANTSTGELSCTIHLCSVQLFNNNCPYIWNTKIIFLSKVL